jgi:Oxygenase domain of the 2OGFeDO superfamily
VTISVEPQMSDAQAAELKGNLLDASHVRYTIGDESTTVVTPEGNVLAILIKDAVPSTLCATAEPFFRNSATQPLIGSFRGTAAGEKMLHPIKKDGTVSKMLEVPDVPRLRGVKHGVLGYMDKTNLNPCRTTSYTRDHWEQFSTTVMPYVRAVDQVFQTYMPERWAAQNSVAVTTPDYTIAGTAFSTITVNLNFATATHQDNGDLAEGFGVLTCFRSGGYSGGSLVFPKHGLAVNVGTGDVLLADVHQWHGNISIIGTQGEYQRLSCVMYYRSRLPLCPHTAR